MKPPVNTTVKKPAAGKGSKVGQPIGQPEDAQDPHTMVNVNPGAMSSRMSNIEHVLDNMNLSHGTGLMLGGSTGIGKTTFVEQLGKILGVKVIVIEAPHITEEHLINIPFITFEPMHNTGKEQTVVVDTNNFGVTLARSHLATELRNAVPISDQTYLSVINASSANTKSLFMQLGGTDTTIPDEIKNIRRKYKVVLFLDEYFRQTSANVRNILRGILNGKIGNDNIPPGVYTIYASNLTDVGQTIEQIPLNADFKMVDFKPPTKNEFFHYLISKFEKDTHVKLHPEVINAFYAELDDTHISYDDLNTEIRTSPRRWEQIILYINANTPVTSEDDAKALMANVKANFSSEDQTSELYNIVVGIVKNIMKTTGASGFAAAKPLQSSDWRKTLENQIATKIKLGDARKYIPVVMGQPGIGKTQHMATIANDLNLRLVSIDCSTLTAEDITGIPIPKKELDKTMSVEFALPSLYQRIENDMKEADAAFYADADVSAEEKAAYKKQKFKYLLFFDELNRVNNQKVFNSLRRVILEKSFNDKVKLPDSVIVTAAMNPGDKGTAELTGHLKDAVDLIDARPSWDSFLQFVDKASKTNPNLKAYSDGSKSIAKKVLVGFTDTFAIKKPTNNIGPDALAFHIKIQGEDEMYISPREYWTMYSDLVAGVSRATGKTATDQQSMEQNLYNAILSKLESTLKWIMKKHEIDSPHFLLAVANWLQSNVAQFMIKKRTSIGLGSMLDDVMADSSRHLKDDPDFINYARNFDLNRFTEDMSKYINMLAANAENTYDILLKDEHSAKEVREGTVIILDNLVSKIETIVSEVRIAANVNNLSADITDGLERVIITSIETDFINDEVPDDIMQKMVDKIHAIFS